MSNSGAAHRKAAPIDDAVVRTVMLEIIQDVFNREVAAGRMRIVGTNGAGETIYRKVKTDALGDILS